MPTPVITSWLTADTFLRSRNGTTLPCRRVRGIRSTTLVRLPGEAIAVKYHGTAVVIYYRTGGIMVTSGGFKTKTTKARINRFASENVHSRRFVWYFGNGDLFVDNVILGTIRQRSFVFA